jgi:hypothetical protein
MWKNLPREPFTVGFRRVLDGLLLLSVACLLCCGCGSRQKINLSAAEAQKALDTALTASQNGQTGGKIENSSPPIEVVDADWLNGKKLERYEILGEQSNTGDRSRFSVRLHFRSPQESKEVNYIVIGGSPLRVSQEVDYERSRKWQGFQQGKKGNQK